MAVPSVKGVLLQHAVDRVESYLASGRLSRDQLEVRLERDDLGVFDGEKIVGGFWYPAARYERLLELIHEVEGRRPEALVEYGRSSGEQLLGTSAFSAIFAATARRTGAEGAGPLVVKLAELVLNFTRWRFRGASLDDFTVEVSEAADYHELARRSVEGLIEVFGSRLFGKALRVTSERPTPDRIVYRARAARQGG
jgi:hypothetical protein